MTLRQWLDQASADLSKNGVESARLEGQLLAGHGLGHDRAWILTNPNFEVPSELNSLLERRLAWEPLSYILGVREFYGRPFKVTPAVLIPRQDTEVLVDAASAFLRSRPGSTALDLGTGSGAIAVTLSLECPQAKATACDVSPGALAIAKANASTLGAEVVFVESDWFAAIPQSFDLLVCNPPYIANSEVLPPDVLLEPSGALFSGKTGLEAYEILSESGLTHINAGGRFMVEIGFTQAETVTEVFARRGWQRIASHPDMAGHTRVLEFEPKSR